MHLQQQQHQQQIAGSLPQQSNANSVTQQQQQQISIKIIQTTNETNTPMTRINRTKNMKYGVPIGVCFSKFDFKILFRNILVIIFN
jgi:hypothetical protein